MIPELQQMVNQTVLLQLLSKNNITVSYEGILIEVYKDTDRIVIEPKYICTTVNNRVYHAPYNIGPNTLGFDIDSIVEVDDVDNIIKLQEAQ